MADHPFSTPGDLVAGLQSSDPGVRDRAAGELGSRCRPDLHGMIAQRFPRTAPGDQDRLTRRALHGLGLRLRIEDHSRFQGVSWTIFGQFARIVVLRALSAEPAALTAKWLPSASIPQVPAWEVRTYQKPFEEVGGDRIELAFEGDRTLWALVADVTGHGWPAHFPAEGLPALWRYEPVARLRAEGAALTHVLSRMHEELKVLGSLFVEASLGRYHPDGRVELAMAGAQHVLRLRGAACSSHQPGGSWLNFPDEGFEIRTQNFACQPGDQVMQASDGWTDQLAPQGNGQRIHGVVRDRWQIAGVPGRDLFSAAVDLFEQGCKHHPQHDDVSLVVFSYRGGGK